MLSTPLKKSLCFLMPCIAYIFFILLDNRLLPGISGTGDTVLFATFGHAWLQDMLPYVDLFDHKGPAIFFVNMLGVAMGQGFEQIELGIVLLEVLFAAAWLALAFWLFRKNPIYGLWALLSGIVVLLRDAHNGGNFTEEYCLVFAMACVVVFFSQNISLKGRFFLYGLCGAATFLFRMNNAIVPFMICVFAFCQLRSLPEWKEAFVAALVGFLTIMLPTVLYFYAHDAFSLMLDGALRYNFTYVNHDNAVQGMLKMVWRFAPSLTMDGLLLAWLVAKQRNVRTLQAIILFFTTLFIGCLLSGRAYNHYMITLLPAHFFLCYAAMPTLGPAAHTWWERTHARFVSLQKMTTPRAYTIFLCVILIATGVKAVLRFDTTPLHEEKALLQEAGVHKDSAILNLNRVKGCRVFVAASVLPRQRIFFEPTGQGPENQKYLFGRTVPEDYTQKYDFIVGDADFTHESYEPVTTFHWGVLHKRRSE